jgi:hypothetical protein
MKICVETGDSEAYFFAFDGRKLNQAIKRTKHIFMGNIVKVWSYTGVKNHKNIESFTGVEDITNKFI